MKKSVDQTEKLQTASTGLINFTIKTLCCIALTGLISGYAMADQTRSDLTVAPQPTLQDVLVPPPPQPYSKGLRPPPRGKVWVEINGLWSLVIAPPAYGPYIWVNGRWVPDTAPQPSNAEWVPGHWSRHGWVQGHWGAVSPAPYSSQTWVPGHWNGNVWVTGHWSGNHPRHKRWVPGHHGRHGWVPGHWR